MPLIWLKFATCNDLAELKNQIRESFAYCEHYDISQPLEISRAIDTALMPLWGELPEQHQQELAQKIQYWRDGEHLAALCNYYFLRAQLAFHQCEYQDAGADLIRAEPFFIAVPGTIIERLWYIYRYLTGLQTHNNPDTDAQLLLVSNWADHGPILKPYIAFMKAETIAVQSSVIAEIRNVYFHAIDLAHEHGYVFLEAFAFERLGVALSTLQHASSQLYYHEAMRVYITCNAPMYAKLLAERFRLTLPNTNLDTQVSFDETNSNRQLEQRLDSEFLLDATQRS
ncbi:MAG: hypothetical protein JKX83_09850 [Pseudomonadales bacterium]|nr:hypothetical protein [Pseudomonadales bacterium]